MLALFRPFRKAAAALWSATIRDPAAQWVYSLLRALPGDQACLTPSPARLLADLTPALGRQNDTTWPYAAARFVKRTDRVHRIPPHVRDVRTPLCWDGTKSLSC